MPTYMACTISGRDRTRLSVADINVIDFDRLKLEVPEMVYDLPAGGRRVMQRARGYDAVIVAGEVTIRNDAATGALPGRLHPRSSSRRRANSPRPQART